VELVELDATVTIGRPHHREGGPDILEPDQAADQRPFDGRLAFELEAQLDEERLDGFEIGDDEKNVVHPLDRHGGLLGSCEPFLVERIVRTRPDPRAKPTLGPAARADWKTNP